MLSGAGEDEPMPSHIYFDFFGTLVRYDPSILPRAFNAPLEFARRASTRVGQAEADALWTRAWDELDSAAHRSGRECSMLQIASRYWELLGSPTIGEGELARLAREYLAVWSAQVAPATGVRTCLQDLCADHVLSVVSNTHDAALVPRLLRELQLDTYFDRVFTSIELGWRKPHRQIFRMVLDAHGIAAQDAVFVGDNWDADIRGPQAVGMRACYVGARERGREPVSLAQLPGVVRGA